MVHESLAATVDMAVLPGVLECSFDKLRTSSPATYRSGTPRVQHHAVARWHVHLHGLATAIHETSGLKTGYKAAIGERTLVLLAGAAVTVTTYVFKSLSKKGGKTYYID